MRTLALAYPKALVGTFYRRHAWGGQIPKTGGLVIYTNHVNGLMDADMPLFLTDRQQFFLAKPSLFRMPGISWVIRTVGAIPIYRQKDKVDMSKNHDSFREIHRVLRAGGAIALYPEGESLLSFRTRPFKTGAARMVLGAQEVDSRPIQLIPVALLYEEQETFLCRVHLWVGEPFDLQASMADYANDSRQTVRKVTALLQERLDELMVPVDDLSTFKVLLNADRILSEDANGTAPRVRALALAWQPWAEENPASAEDMKRRLTTFGGELEAFGLEARDLCEQGLLRPFSWWLTSVLSLAWGILLAPLLAPPIALACTIASIGRSTPDKLVTVTTIASSVLVPVWGIVLTYLVTRMETPLPDFWGTLAGFWALAYVSRRLSLYWKKPRALRRTLTGLGLIGRKQRMCDLWKRKQALLIELQTLFPNR
jgi:1-acyl-sn-glycerol-3-phosphate acyltransferase